MRPYLVRRRSRSSLVAALGLAFAAAACKYESASQPTGFCAAPYTPAVSVIVADSVTGRPLADSAYGVAQAGTSVDSLHRVSAPADALVGGVVPGSYEVRIERVGYAPWTRSGIAVASSGVCSELNTVSLTAKLRALP